MALTIPSVLHSLYGRKLGLDKDGFVVGHPGPRDPVETSTAASTLAASGVSILSGSTASFTLPGAAAPGVRKTIINGSSISTATMTITRASSALSIVGSTGGDANAAAIALLHAGTAVSLIAVSTLQWALASSRPSTLFQSMSTSS
jgi:hypothetical protein